MSLLGLVAYIGCFLGGAASTDAARPACAAQGVLSTDFSSPHQAALPGKLPARSAIPPSSE